MPRPEVPSIRGCPSESNCLWCWSSQRLSPHQPRRSPRTRATSARWTQGLRETPTAANWFQRKSSLCCSEQTQAPSHAKPDRSRLISRPLRMGLQHRLPAEGIVRRLRTIPVSLLVRQFVAGGEWPGVVLVEDDEIADQDRQGLGEELTRQEVPRLAAHLRILHLRVV